eukprot:Rhum_TRINITY_DN1092_c0_g1::Rhum_TRINITY_DN1092_c0_g1_i1::g.3264::m.3264
MADPGRLDAGKRMLRSAGLGVASAVKVAGNWAGHLLPSTPSPSPNPAPAAAAASADQTDAAESHPGQGQRGLRAPGIERPMDGDGSLVQWRGLPAADRSGAGARRAAWRFRFGDTVVVQEAGVLAPLAGSETTAAAPQRVRRGDQATVVALPDASGAVEIRCVGGDGASGLVDAAAVSHPIVTLRVAASLPTGLDVHCTPFSDGVRRRLLGGDTVALLRVEEVRRGNEATSWFQTVDGGWVQAHPDLLPVYVPGLPVKVLIPVSFDNGRKVRCGCFGTVTRVPGEAAGSVAEVSADGVTWDAWADQVEPVLPQCLLTPSDCLGLPRLSPAAFERGMDDDGASTSDSSARAEPDATVYSDGEDEADTEDEGVFDD